VLDVFIHNVMLIEQDYARLYEKKVEELDEHVQRMGRVFEGVEEYKETDRAEADKLGRLASPSAVEEHVQTEHDPNVEISRLREQLAELMTEVEASRAKEAEELDKSRSSKKE
jgi:hypothetical protein